MTVSNKVKNKAKLLSKMKKLEVELKDLQKKFIDIKKRAENFIESSDMIHTNSEIKKLRENIN